MPRSGRKTLTTVALAAGAVAFLGSRGPAFVPAPTGRSGNPVRSQIAAAAPVVPALMAAAPAAFADQISDASAKFSEAAYPVAKAIDWGNYQPVAKYLAEESAKNPKGVAKAVEALLEAGLTMDPKLIQAAVKAHDKALDTAVNNPGLVASQSDFAAVNEALARMIASADPEKFFYLLSAFPGNKELQMQMFSANNEADARKAYEAFVGLTDAVRAQSLATPHAKLDMTVPAVTGPIGDAARAVADATYPIASKINWGNTPEISKYIAEASAKDPKGVAKAIDKTLELAETMSPATIKNAVAAHANAIESALASPNLMTSKADWATVMESLAALIKSSDPAKFKAILTAFPGNADLQMALFGANNAADAQAAYKTFVALTDAVKR